MTTAAEKAIIEQTTKAIESGEDPFGDNDGFDTTTQTDAEQLATNAAATKAEADKESDEVTKATEGDPAADAEGNHKPEDAAIDALALEEIANGDDTPAPSNVADPLNFNINAPADYKTARAALLAEKSEAMAKMMNGEIDASEFAAIETRVMDSLEDLSAQRIRAETLQELNLQSAAQSQAAVIQALIARTTNEIQYATDAKAQRQFDIALQGFSADPDMAGKSFVELTNEAHKVVLALRGISTAKQQSSEKSQEELAAIAAARTPSGKPPVTLRSIPPQQQQTQEDRSLKHCQD